PRPFLHRLLALNRFFDLLMGLDINESGDAIFLREFRAAPFLVLPNAARHVIRDADIERPVPAAGEDVDEIAHRLIGRFLGPGDKPRDDSGNVVKSLPQLQRRPGTCVVAGAQAALQPWQPLRNKKTGVLSGPGYATKSG